MVPRLTPEGFIMMMIIIVRMHGIITGVMVAALNWKNEVGTCQNSSFSLNLGGTTVLVLASFFKLGGSESPSAN